MRHVHDKVKRLLKKVRGKVAELMVDRNSVWPTDTRIALNVPNDPMLLREEIDMRRWAPRRWRDKGVKPAGKGKSSEAFVMADWL